MKKIVTIIAIVLAIAVGDLALTYNNFIVNRLFCENDFEITQYKHPEKVWDKVFFEMLLFHGIYGGQDMKDMSISMTTVLLPTCGKND